MSKPIKVKNFTNLIGQEKLKLTFMTMINAANKMKSQLDHILLTGPSGMGKTSFAETIAHTLQTNIHFSQGPLMKTKTDVLVLFSTIKNGDIIFIDEIHSINKNIQELFYLAMDKQALDLILDNRQQKTMRLKLPPFTLIGATTKVTNLSTPFRTRFGFIAEFTPYQINEIMQMITLNANQNGWKISPKASSLLAEHSRFNPRVAKNLLKRVIEMCVINNLSFIDEQIVQKTLENLNIYKFGLTQNHIVYLQTLHHHFQEQWTSFEVICHTLLMERPYLESEIEPILLQNNLIIKSTRGRKITNIGIKYLYDLK